MSSVRNAMELEGQPAKIRHLERLTDDELLQLIDFHGGYFIQWFETHENPRLSLIYHGQILWALLDECDRRGKTVTQLGAEFRQQVAMQRAWEQTPGNA